LFCVEPLLWVRLEAIWRPRRLVLARWMPPKAGLDGSHKPTRSTQVIILEPYFRAHVLCEITESNVTPRERRDFPWIIAGLVITVCGALIFRLLW
jgi:hypothetical protein